MSRDFGARAVAVLATATDLRPQYEARHQRWDATLKWRINRTYAVEFVAANLTADSFLDRTQGGRVISRRNFCKNYLLTFNANRDTVRLPFFDRGD